MKAKIFSFLISVFAAVNNCLAQGSFHYDQQVDDTSPPGIFANALPGPTGQSFVPGFSSVGFVQLYLTDSDPNHAGAVMCVNIWVGSLTNGTLLGSSSPVSFPGIFQGQATFLFSTPISLTPGDTYYLQPVIQSGDSNQLGIVGGFRYSSGNAFVNGTALPNADLWFREGIVVPEPSSAAMLLLGACAWFAQKRKRRV